MTLGEIAKYKVTRKEKIPDMKIKKVATSTLNVKGSET